MKIMIADDEVIIRTGLAEVIKWQELGLELLPPAESAEEALGRIGQERPDILLTDIRMTGRTGLELAEEARATLPNLEVIILTGYDDFHYVQQALRQQVSDYLLKTSRPEEIIRTVLKAKQRVEERKESQSRDVVRYREERSRRFVRWIVDGATDNEDDHRYMHSVFTEIAAEAGPIGDWQTLLIMAEGWGESEGERDLLRFAVDNMIGDLLPCVSIVHQQSIIVALPAVKDEVGKQQRRSIYGKIEHLLKCKLTVVGGKAVRDWSLLHESWLSAVEARQYKILLSQPQWEYADIAHRKGGKTVCSIDEEKELSAILMEDDPIRLKAWVVRFLRELREDPDVTPRSLEASVRSAAIAAHRWLERILHATGKNGALEEPLPPFLMDAASLAEDQLFQHLYGIMKLYHHRIADGRRSHVQKAIAYIEENWGLNLGLQQVADYVHLHPNHLSDLFKRETGVKFMDFVTRKKMQRASELLASSPAKVSEVAAMVGYEDTKYFGQMFKKHTGRTPSEYREAQLANKGKSR